jgi:cholest-4-en-3-one 26-monooxygenase
MRDLRGSFRNRRVGRSAAYTGRSLRPGDLNLADPDALLEHGIPPHDYLATLRREAPVHWNPAPDDRGNGMLEVSRGFWVLTRYSDVLRASRETDSFSSWLGTNVIWDATSDPLHGLEAQRKGIMCQDPPQHSQLRQLVQSGFSPRIVDRLEPAVRAHARTAVERLEERVTVDAVSELAADLPSITLCELMGIPQQDRHLIRRWGSSLAHIENDDGSNSESAMRLLSYCHELVKDKRANPDDSALSVYANTPVNGELLSDGQINSFFLTLAIAGHETTRSATVHFIRLMHEHPRQYELLRADLGRRLPNAIDEVLRYSPPVVQFRRTATREIEISGVTIEAGAKVYLSYASANRDERVFDDPERFDILRTDAKRHLSFGVGPHFCLGAPLARMQLRCLLEELYTKAPEVDLDEDPAWLRSIWFNGITSMPVSTRRR